MGNIEIGMAEDLMFSTPNIVAIFSCITETNGEIIKNGKPFFGIYIDETDTIGNWVFDESIAFIDKYIEKGDVQVICDMGTSRSVAIALAYYVYKGYSYENAVKKLSRGKPACARHEYSLKIWMNAFYK